MNRIDLTTIFLLYCINFYAIRLTYKDARASIKLEQSRTNVLPFRRYSRLDWIRKKRNRKKEQ